MKYCFNWYGNNNSKLLDIADEINIDLSKIKDLNDIPEFCEIHKNQRINLCINDYEAGINNDFFNLALSIQDKYKEIYNIVIRFPSYDKELQTEFLDKYPDAKYFFNIYVKTWDVLYGLLSLNITDIYLTENLCFNLSEVRNMINDMNEKVQIRVFPNVAQSSWQYLEDIKKFFIRPEDVYLYNEYIDIFEFYGEDKKQEIYYDIYFKDQEWFGPLNELILDFNDTIDSTTIVPRFGMSRLNCRQRCLQGRSCRMCNAIESLASNFERLGVKIDPKEVRKNYGERSNSESGNNEENTK